MFHFKLPSPGLYEAVYLIWKQGNTDSDKTPAQLKLVENHKLSSKTFYSRWLKKKIRFKLRELRMIELHFTIYVIKNQLGNARNIRQTQRS